MNSFVKRFLSVFLLLALSFAALSCEGSSSGKKSNSKKDVQDTALTVTKSEARQVTYEKYTGPEGYFTIEIPKGWKVAVGLKPDLEVDLISYAITVYDPAHPERQLYFNLNCAAVLKSEAAHDWYVTAYGASNLFAEMPWLEEESTAGYFIAMSENYGYSDFTVMENAGKSATGGEVLVARSIWETSGRKSEGLFFATLDFSSTYYVKKNPYNVFDTEVIDAWPVTAYTVVFLNAAEDEFIEWRPVLEHSLSTLSFSAKFQEDRQAAWRQLMGNAAYIAATADGISDMIMDSWEKRNASYDVLSEKQSDATLGYERVYDTETKEYYRAENGFSDWYQGDRYEIVTDDRGYLEPISGYLNWK